MAELSSLAEQPSDAKVDDGDLMSRIQDWFWTSDDNTREWRDEARRCRRFVDGHQWEEEDVKALKAKGKPALTFNRVGPVIDAVIGLEIATRQETAVKPRGVEDAQPSEVFTGLIKWLRDQSKAPDAETEAFRDMTIGGVGWCDTQADGMDTPESGQVLRKATKTRIDPEYVWFDHAAGERNMVNGRYVFVMKDVAYEHARALIPPPKGEDWELADYDAAWARVTREQWKQRSEFAFSAEAQAERDKRKGLVTLVEVQWYEYAEDGSRQEMKANVGGRVLRSGPNPVQGKGFSIQAITGKRDTEINGWYGIVRPMIEPQAYTNKFMSQYLHIVNTQANGGLLIEENAVEDLDEFNANFSKPDRNVIVADGAIAGQRIMPKPQVSVPAGLRDLMQLAMDAPYNTTGISPEMLGMVQREQAGVLEESRKQAAVGILAWVMESGRQHRQESGEYFLGVVKTMVPPQLAVRVLGEQNGEAVMAAYQPGVDEYDIVVDESPQSPNQKERSWVMMQPLLPYMIERAPPEVLLEALRYSPLPSSLVSGLEKALSTSQQDPEQQAQKQLQMETMRLTLEKLQAEVAKLQADAQLSQARAQGEMVDAQVRPIEVQAKLMPKEQAAPNVQMDQPEPYAPDQALADVHKTIAETRKIEVETALLPEKAAREREAQTHQQSLGTANFIQGQRAHEDSTRLGEMKLNQPPRGNGSAR